MKTRGVEQKFSLDDESIILAREKIAAPLGYFHTVGNVARHQKSCQRHSVRSLGTTRPVRLGMERHTVTPGSSLKEFSSCPETMKEIKIPTRIFQFLWQLVAKKHLGRRSY